MSVNNIDFTLGSYNPNQAVGLLDMARENDKQISDSLKGILDGFEKTARQNADVQAMNYINSLGLEDMTPDKMVGHTQVLEQISNNMGGLNPSKEALTALDGRGNVLTQRETNTLALEAQDIANKSNSFDMQEKGDNRVLDMALNSVIANPSMAKEIKGTLPPHLQALFDEKVEYRIDEQTSKANTLNNTIINQRADSAWNTISAFTPNFASSDGTVDYAKMFNDNNVITALGDAMRNPEVIGLVLQKMDKEAAEKLKAAHDMEMDKRKLAVGEDTLGVAQKKLEDEAARWRAQLNYDKEKDASAAADAKAEKERVAANEVNDTFQKNIKDTAFYGSVSKNADGSLNVDPEKLAASVSNRLSAAARPVEVKYKYPSVDAWWVENKNFGVSNLDLGITLARQSGVQDMIKSEFSNFRDPSNNKVSKNTEIAMLEKLKASKSESTNLGYTSTSDAFGNSAYYKNGKLNMNALYADVINDRINLANDRVTKESFNISRDAANLGIKLDLLNDHLKTNLAQLYPTADLGFLNSIYLGKHNSGATAPLTQGGSHTNSAVSFFKGNSGTGKNTVRR